MCLYHSSLPSLCMGVRACVRKAHFRRHQRKTHFKNNKKNNNLSLFHTHAQTERTREKDALPQKQRHPAAQRVGSETAEKAKSIKEALSSFFHICTFSFVFPPLACALSSCDALHSLLHNKQHVVVVVVHCRRVFSRIESDSNIIIHAVVVFLVVVVVVL